MSTRNFKLVGAVEGECTGTITLNGVEVFNGTFVGNDWATRTDNDSNPMCVGSLTFDDSANVSMPSVVSVTGGSGKILVGMYEWNQDLIVNPALTPEEYSYINTPIPDIPAGIRASVADKGGFYIRDAYAFDYGLDETVAHENRSNLVLNSSAISPGPGQGIVLVQGDTLTFNNSVFFGPQA